MENLDNRLLKLCSLRLHYTHYQLKVLATSQKSVEIQLLAFNDFGLFANGQVTCMHVVTYYGVHFAANQLLSYVLANYKSSPGSLKVVKM